MVCAELMSAHTCAWLFFAKEKKKKEKKKKKKATTAFSATP
jgi:hypothetical protein